MIYGYARCSTCEEKQDVQRQIRELKASGAEKVIFDYEHGDAKVKQNLHMLLNAANEGDTILTLEVSRLTRSTQQLCEIVDTIKQKRLRLVIVGSITVDCRNGEIDPMSQAFIQMSAVFAELELSIYSSKSEKRYGKCKGQGPSHRPQAHHQGRYTRDFLQTLSRAAGWKAERQRTGESVWVVKAHGV